MKIVKNNPIHYWNKKKEFLLDKSVAINTITQWET